MSLYSLVVIYHYFIKTVRAMTRDAILKAGNRHFMRTYKNVDTLRSAIASGDVEATQDAWDKLEETIDMV